MDTKVRPDPRQARNALARPQRRSVARKAGEDGGWIGWKRSDGSEDPEPAVLSSAVHHGPTQPREAVRVIAEAEGAFEGHGARVEYCRAKGVDYERSLRYIPVLQSLENAFESDGESATLRNPPLWPPLNRNHLLSDQSSRIPYLEVRTPYLEVRTGVRVRIAGMSDEEFDQIVREGKCPLCCRDRHELVMCPMMPNEMKPFC